MTYLATAFAILALVTSTLMAGFFFSYSITVMWGLDAASPVSAIDAMQNINSVVQNPWFFPNFFGVPVFTIGAAILFFMIGQPRSASAFGLAAIAYLLGAFAVTVAVNVPMNEALGRETIPQDIEVARTMWAQYSERWTFWNHVRSIASLASALACGLGIFLAGRAAA
ncbi:DUF1772 domain-containing protein [Pelagibacterium sp. 26DY04]|uniref:anthrone oxygenase family protein n=1 Tax=Pelagibacterium sp. 26DY04 TaxID=2967130 RepID=UPI0028152D97|nr:anthrone oxygenase family protein [Pelagibacterium sp. 26DY04]WMT85348.1 DUF1772 domain-containing protein [Pelagibacterium sp. 26DY04]